jgi:pimeloyl-ACP methyl ester carboxylesterase
LADVTRISSEKADTTVDVVFVHGLGGNDRTTWQIEADASTFWPSWIDQDLPRAIVSSLGYQASASNWLGHTMPIVDRATNLLDALTLRGIGQRPVIFVAHSLGGILVKQLLRNAESYGNAASNDLLKNTRGVVFIATPHEGAAIPQLLSVLSRVLRLTETIDELQPDTSGLRDLHQWYRTTVGKISIEHLVYCESIALGGALIVSKSSADPGLVGVVPIPIDGDHLSICKPANRNEQIYVGVLKFISGIVQAASAPLDEPATDEKTTYTSFGETNTLSTVIDALDDRFRFRWERGSFDVAGSEPIVYWPVRLRRPTPIHAVQCFTAAALEQRGAKIHLFIDDLGQKDKPIDDFTRVLIRWFGSVGGRSENLVVTTFSETVSSTNSDAFDPWPTIQRWLGDTEDRLDRILRVAKLVPRSDPSFTLQKLEEKRPRRLLTPAMVWSCLQHLRQKISDRPVITLGGYDEQPLWHSWASQSLHSDSVGHLYVPQLSKVDGQHGTIPLHMEREGAAIEWNSKDDIRNALQAELASDAWHATDRLIPWCLTCCSFLPRFLTNQELGFSLDSKSVNPNTTLEQLDLRRSSPELVNELAKWLI